MNFCKLCGVGEDYGHQPGCMKAKRDREVGLLKEIRELRTEIMHLKAASRPTAQGGGWLPIETAPKDGTYYWASDGKDHWQENAPDGHSPGHWTKNPKTGNWCGQASNEDATHWMPLPSPPPQAANDGEG